MSHLSKKHLQCKYNYYSNMQHTRTQTSHNVVSDGTVLQGTAGRDMCSDKTTCCSVKSDMCVQVGLWEGTCYMQLSPGSWGYPGGMQMSQVLSFEILHARSSDVINVVCHAVLPKAQTLTAT